MEAEHSTPALGQRSVSALAAVAVRTFELVEEFRWRYDTTAVTFCESISASAPAHLRSLQLLGRDDAGALLWCATADAWYGGRFVPARIDAGALVVEAPSFDALLAGVQRRTSVDPAALHRLYAALGV